MSRLVRAHPRVAAALAGLQLPAELLYLALQRPNEHILYGDEMGCLAGG
jgi:hypothetical protein